MIIETRAVTKSYGPSPALRGVSLVLRQGEIVAVTGPSGCGKSTLLHLMAGILRPDGGEVLYRGARIDDLGEARRSLLRRTDFGVLFQFGQLVAELPAVENVALPLMLGGTGRRQATAQAADWLDRLGVAELAKQLPGEMSGGQQQRVALARALVTGPKVLFADEPTGALDTLAGEMVMGHMVRAARTQGTSVMLVTHDATVAAYADREIRLRDGMLESDDDALIGSAWGHSGAGAENGR
ncbi:ABC transporter ATP-binding protein [Streptomyces sp. NBC_01232]|uniref:ABC transporter ATP-binding protein n=1 Tax=Streptomyces sp. NBC_01232 TaxID=2903786 RepID=UPI002E0EEAAD|nr:ABC transporter ATP-binding protein [Streptomyces sp. NBC_01232]